MPVFFMLACLVNMVAVLLTIRYFLVLFGGQLNAEGQRCIEGVPTNPLVLLNSGLPALKMVGVLYRRQYRSFGDDRVTQAGDLAFTAQMVGLVGTLSVFAMVAMGKL